MRLERRTSKDSSSRRIIRPLVLKRPLIRSCCAIQREIRLAILNQPYTARLFPDCSSLGPVINKPLVRPDYMVQSCRDKLPLYSETCKNKAIRISPTVDFYFVICVPALPYLYHVIEQNQPISFSHRYCMDELVYVWSMRGLHSNTNGLPWELPQAQHRQRKSIERRQDIRRSRQKPEQTQFSYWFNSIFYACWRTRSQAKKSQGIKHLNMSLY